MVEGAQATTSPVVWSVTLYIILLQINIHRDLNTVYIRFGLRPQHIPSPCVAVGARLTPGSFDAYICGGSGEFADSPIRYLPSLQIQFICTVCTASFRM